MNTHTLSTAIPSAPDTPPALFVLLDACGVEQQRAADLLGVSKTLLSFWVHRQRPIPAAHYARLFDFAWEAFRQTLPCGYLVHVDARGKHRLELEDPTIDPETFYHALERLLPAVRAVFEEHAQVAESLYAALEAQYQAAAQAEVSQWDPQAVREAEARQKHIQALLRYGKRLHLWPHPQDPRSPWHMIYRMYTALEESLAHRKEER